MSPKGANSHWIIDLLRTKATIKCTKVVCGILEHLPSLYSAALISCGVFGFHHMPICGWSAWKRFMSNHRYLSLGGSKVARFLPHHDQMVSQKPVQPDSLDGCFYVFYGLFQWSSTEFVSSSPALKKHFSWWLFTIDQTIAGAWCAFVVISKYANLPIA